MNKSKSSQVESETHKTRASHKNKETQGKEASQAIGETHYALAKEQNILRELGRVIAGSYYDHQEVRITEFNRIRDIIRRKIEGIPLTGGVEEKKEEKDKHQEKFVDKKIPIYLQQLVNDGELTKKEEQYINKILEVQKNAEKYEIEYKKLMQEYVEGEIIFKEFLTKIKGISSVLSANLLKEFGYCENAQHISSLWKYCGMHVVNGEAPKRKKGVKLDFALKRRTMVWKIGDSFIKQRTPFYRDIYDKEKARQLNLMEDSQEAKANQNLLASHIKKENQIQLANTQPVKLSKPESLSEPASSRNPLGNSVPKSLMHCHLRAMRKMIKIFLAHYWMACKDLQPGDNSKPQLSSEPYKSRKPSFLSEQKPYVSTKLGHKHISDWKMAVEAQLIKKNKIKKIVQPC